MSHETELLAFLHEVLGMRVENRGLDANCYVEYVKATQELSEFLKSITDDNMRTILLEHEEINSHISHLLMRHMYKAGIKDSITLLRLILKLVLFQD